MGLPESRSSATGALLEEWSRRYRAPLLRFFERRTRADADREDLVQETFARLARRDDLGSVERIEAYLFQTAASVLADFQRKRRTHRADAHVEIDDALAVDPAASPERVLLGKEAVEILARALPDLPERARAIFTLYHFETMPHRDIARRLGVSVSTVEKDMARANLVLLRRLREEG